MRIKSFSIKIDDFKNLKIIDPVGYVESVSYQKYANYFITDSGGIQKEEYILGVKCITLRSETERIEILCGGWNTLLFNDESRLKNIINTPLGKYENKLYGNGHAVEAIVDVIAKQLNY